MSEMYTREKFQQAAADFTGRLKPLLHHATVVGLYGDLGSGKTTFVQAAAKELGVTETVSSPTFLICKTYQLPNASTYKLFVHVDAYRLKGGEELRRLHFEELLTDPTNLILVEWADLVSDILPEDHLKIFFEFVDDSTRRIAFPSPRSES